MHWLTVALGAAVMLGLALVMVYILGRAQKAWRTEENPMVARVEQALAGLDCGQCGYPTCNQYALAIVEEGDTIDKCLPGGQASIAAVAEALGMEPPEVGAHVAVVHCGAESSQKMGVADYRGEPSCGAADVAGGVQRCAYGCLGLGDCERSCPFDAIHVIDALAVVSHERCTACGNCVRACPRNIITIEEFQAQRMLVVACCNHDPGSAVRKFCSVGCIACGRCERTCPLFTVQANLARIDYNEYEPDKHDEMLSEASGKCPTGCLPFRGKGADRGYTPADAEQSPQGEQTT